MQVHHIKQGDTRPYFQVELDLGAGVGPVLTAGTVLFKMWGRQGEGMVVNAAATVVDANAAGTGMPVVEYRWTAADTDVAGRYDAEWEATLADGTIQTFPAKGHDRVVIEGDLDGRV